VEGEGMRIPDAFLTELRQRIDIVDVVSEYVSLRRTGRNFVGLCPFHNERTPSFSVSPDRQYFHCFGCGAGGNVIQFIMELEGLSFTEAVQHTASRAGLELPVELMSDHAQQMKGTSRRQRMKDAHELAAKWYNYSLMNTTPGVQALKYLENRGLAKTTVVEFRIGYAPEDSRGVVQFLEKRGFERDLLLESGIAVELGPQVLDRFRGRVMIPIMDAQGNVVAFGGRAIKGNVQPKYLNSPETPIFRKSHMLYNQHQARKTIRQEKSVVLMEGYMDVISAWQAGVPHAVASLGTAFSSEQAAILKRYSERLIIAYDGDNAGVTAAKRALVEAAGVGLECRVLVLPNGSDPDEFIQQEGAAVFRNQLSVAALTPVQFGIHDLRRLADLNSVAGRQALIREILALLATQATPIEVETEIRQLSSDFQVSIDSLKEELARLAKSTSAPSRRVQQREAERSLPAARMKGDVLAGAGILHAILIDTSAYQYLLDGAVDELATPEQTALLAMIYGFRSEYPTADASQFVESLEDEELRQLAIEVFVLDSPAPTREVLEDYLRTIRMEKLTAARRVAIEEWKKAQLRQDSDAIIALKDQMDVLWTELQVLQQLKSTP
jgi:DNA primase